MANVGYALARRFEHMLSPVAELRRVEPVGTNDTERLDVSALLALVRKVECAPVTVRESRGRD